MIQCLNDCIIKQQDISIVNLKAQLASADSMNQDLNDEISILQNRLSATISMIGDFDSLMQLVTLQSQDNAGRLSSLRDDINALALRAQIVVNF